MHACRNAAHIISSHPPAPTPLPLAFNAHTHTLTQHEHIALLGKALTASEEEGYEIARHLADYVLIWGGGGGDDLAKSPHLARIAK